MPYTDVTAVKERLAAEGVDKSGSTAAAMEDGAIQKAVDDAIAEIDARVSSAPFEDPTPSLITAIATDIAGYLATLTWRKGNPLPDGHPVQLRYARAQLLLQKAEDGKLDLLEPEGPEGAGVEATVVNRYIGDLWTLEDFGLYEVPR